MEYIWQCFLFVWRHAQKYDQCIKYKGTTSKPLRQRSKTSPLLYILHINNFIPELEQRGLEIWFYDNLKFADGADINMCVFVCVWFFFWFESYLVILCNNSFLHRLKRYLEISRWLVLHLINIKLPSNISWYHILNVYSSRQTC